MHCDKPVATSPQGNVLVLTVVVMAGIALMLLSMLYRQMAWQQRMGVNEAHYWQARELAESALNWGLRQDWPHHHYLQWHCLPTPLASARLKSCLRVSHQPDVFILRGQGRFSQRSAPMMVFQLVTLDDSGERFQLVKLPQGRLDFCPYADKQAC
jgi:hypothetical protein